MTQHPHHQSHLHWRRSSSRRCTVAAPARPRTTVIASGADGGRERRAAGGTAAAVLVAIGLAALAPLSGCTGREDVSMRMAAPVMADADGDRATSPHPRGAHVHRSIDDAAADVTAERIREGVAFLASDAMNGRHWKSPEGFATAEWIAQRMADAGLQPGGGPLGRVAGAAPSFYRSLARHPDASPNVIGVLRGTRPGSAAVVVTAHYDHLAPLENAAPGEDAIFNGADDNASGVMGLLEAARGLAMLQDRPVADVWFVAFSGEEAGLHGAKALAKDPPMPLASIRGLINMDMISRSTPNLVCIDGMANAPDLATAILAANARVGRLDLRIDQHPDWLRRSDQAPFLERGVPCVLVSVEDHEDYHQVTDEVEKIDAELAARVARVVLLAAHRLANAER